MASCDPYPDERVAQTLERLRFCLTYLGLDDWPFAANDHKGSLTIYWLEKPGTHALSVAQKAWGWENESDIGHRWLVDEGVVRFNGDKDRSLAEKEAFVGWATRSSN